MATLGHLTVICGPMFSGKTTALIQRLRSAQQAGHSTIAIKPACDTRYHAGALASHAGAALDAVNVTDASQVVAASASAEVVGIDEAHFFGAGLITACDALLARGAQVIVAGLERDHRGQPFEPFPRLLVDADDVIKLSGPCALCGRPAVHSQRLVDSSDRIVVGGAEAYQARCRACFVPGQ